MKGTTLITNWLSEEEAEINWLVDDCFFDGIYLTLAYPDVPPVTVPVTTVAVPVIPVAVPVTTVALPVTPFNEQHEFQSYQGSK